MTPDPNWAQMAHGYQAAQRHTEEAHRRMITNRPSTAKEYWRYRQGIVAGYEQALADLKGLIGTTERNQAQEALLDLIEEQA